MEPNLLKIKRNAYASVHLLHCNSLQLIPVKEIIEPIVILVLSNFKFTRIGYFCSVYNFVVEHCIQLHKGLKLIPATVAVRKLPAAAPPDHSHLVFYILSSKSVCSLSAVGDLHVVYVVFTQS
ncbi:hypothetical protein AVEN_24802-1 [Araneus ventricosus]|uniref:Uncharacterized protein n=1 Tax=Araneus ventricosus TaxID=182803 RepID=A0A4Y2BV16_ARAVE|nr:hypothetical protein AVEN_24802-1 [Araneus ventricosus]